MHHCNYALPSMSMRSSRSYTSHAPTSTPTAISRGNTPLQLAETISGRMAITAQQCPKAHAACQFAVTAAGAIWSDMHHCKQ
jgi:hypothetical protein